MDGLGGVVRMNVEDVLIPVFSILLVVVLSFLVLIPLIMIILFFKGYRFRPGKRPNSKR